MAGAKRTESPSEIDPDVKTEARKSFEHIWLNTAVPVRTMGSFESDAGQRYRSPVSSSMCEHCLITKLQHPPARASRERADYRFTIDESINKPYIAMFGACM